MRVIQFSALLILVAGVFILSGCTSSDNGSNTNSEVMLTVSSVTCEYVRDGQYYAGDGTQEYVYLLSASGSITAPVNTEVQPGRWTTGDSVYPNDETWQGQADSWSGEDTAYKAFRRESGDPATSAWSFSQEITITSGPNNEWPASHDVGVSVEALNYYGEGKARGAVKEVRQFTQCPIP